MDPTGVALVENGAVVNASPFSSLIALAHEVPTPVAQGRPARVSSRQIQAPTFEPGTGTPPVQTTVGTGTAAPAPTATGAAQAPTAAAPANRVRGRPLGSKKRKHEEEDVPAKKALDKKLDNRINSLVKQLEVKEAGMLTAG